MGSWASVKGLFSVKSQVSRFSLLNPNIKRFTIDRKITVYLTKIEFIDKINKIRWSIRFLLAEINVISCFVLSDNNKNSWVAFPIYLS